MRIRFALLLCLALPTPAFAVYWPGSVCVPRYPAEQRVTSLSYNHAANFWMVTGIGGGAFEIVCPLPYDDQAPPARIAIGYQLSNSTVHSSLGCGVQVLSLTGQSLAYASDSVSMATPRTPFQGVIEIG